ncbi:MAG: ABC transporter permease [Bacteroidia bacterium]|nr:ABC transporter permease [Bacteroidia bacterium]
MIFLPKLQKIPFSALVGGLCLFVFLFISITCYQISPDFTQNANLQFPNHRKVPPGTQTLVTLPDSCERSWWNGSSNCTFKANSNSQREFIFWLGTDNLGRDWLSRILVGSRISLGVGFFSILISLGLGVPIGLLAGWRGGLLEQIVMGMVTIFWTLPSMLLAIGVAFVLGKGFWSLCIAIAIACWSDIVRMTRNITLQVKQNTWVEAAFALGFSEIRILFRHILPNLVKPLTVLTLSNFSTAILIESGLSFLGIGISPPTPSWGTCLREGYSSILFQNGLWLLIPPAVCLVSVTVAIYLVASAIQTKTE